MQRVRAVAWAAAGLSLAARALAFDSYGSITAEHGQVTRTAAQAAGFAANAVSLLQKNNRKVDWDQTEVHPINLDGPKIRPNLFYDYRDHFDRGKKTDDGTWRSVLETFNAGRASLKTKIDQAIARAGEGKYSQAFELLGSALHTVQDLNSHSNLVDLTGAEKTQVFEATFDFSKTLPNTFILTSFLSNGDETPADDPLTYTHGAKAKDNAKKNPEAQIVPSGQPLTKFKMAFNSAVGYSTKVLEQFLAGVGATTGDEMKQFALAGPQPGDEKYQFAANGHFTPGSPLTVSGNGSSLSVTGASFDAECDVAILGAPLSVFRENSDLTAPDGRRLGLLREIDPYDTQMFSPGHAIVEFSLSDISGLIPAALQVYYLDPEEHQWIYAPGGSVTVDLVAGTGLAQWDVTATGVYGIGGFAVPEPASAAGLVLAGLALRRRGFPRMSCNSSRRQ
jgi:hypothetical protein